MNDDLSPEVQRLVNLARKARTPGEEDKLRIAERLAVPLAAGAALGSAAGAAKAATGASVFAGLGVKIAAAVAVSAVAAAVVVGQLDSKRAPEVPSAAVHKPQPAQPAASTPSTTEAPTTDQAVEPQPSEPAAPQKPTPPSTRSANPAHEMEEEAALLHQAQSAWRAGQSAQALQLANQHAQRFPHSQLGNERDVLRVLSLCKLGQVHAAKQVGARLLRTAKGSPWYQSVAESCAAP